MELRILQITWEGKVLHQIVKGGKHIEKTLYV